jgi:uncharacterized protein (DUF3084 family)
VQVGAALDAQYKARDQKIDVRFPKDALPVQQRVARLVVDHAALKQEAANATKEAQDLQRRCATLMARVSELERENEVLRKARPASSGSAVTGTKERIDDLVKEIDHCMALIRTD